MARQVADLEQRQHLAVRVDSKLARSWVTRFPSSLSLRGIDAVGMPGSLRGGNVLLGKEQAARSLSSCQGGWFLLWAELLYLSGLADAPIFLLPTLPAGVLSAGIWLLTQTYDPDPK